MVAKESSSEDLPSGWTVLCKVLRTGRKVSIYTNLETGKRLFSRDDVFKHIKAGSKHSDKPLPTNEDTSRHKESTSLQPEPLNGENELPNWLPNGWRVEVRIRKSGVLSGKEYKCYIDPSNTGRFYSKLEVLRYLKTVKRKNHARQATEKHKSSVLEKNPAQQDTTENHKGNKLKKKNPAQQEATENHQKSILQKDCAQQDAAVNHSSNMLEKNPAHSVATENNKKSMLEQDSSHQDATLNDKSSILEKTTGTSMDSEQKVVVQRSVAEGLPPGWIKEIKIRKSSSPIKKDPFYTDPISGYVFRSKKDALRYVQTGVISRNAFKPKNSSVSPPELTKDEVSTSSAAKRQKLKHPTSKRNPSSGKKSPEMSASKLSKTEETKISGVELLPEANVMVSSGDVIVQGKRSSNDITQECARANKNCAKNSSPLPKEGGSRRGGETSPVSDAAVSEKCRVVSVDNEPVSTPTPNISEGNKFFWAAQEKGSAKEARVNSRKSTGKKVHDLPPRSSKRLAGREPDKVANLELGERALISSIKKSKKSEVVEDFNPISDGSVKVEIKPEAELAVPASNKASIPAPNASPKKITALATEELHHNLETEKADDNPELQLSALFGSDPCLEFAFKTLTGELPLDDTSKEGSTLTNSACTVPHENSLESGTKSGATGNGRASRSKSKNKKEPSLPRRSSKRLSGGKPEPVENPLASLQTHQNSSTKPHRKGTILAANSLDAATHAEPSNKRDVPFENLAAHGGKQQALETGKAQFESSEPTPQTLEPEIPESDLSFSIADYWSDPCLDFAFKTLTGVIPIEDTLVHNYFQEQVDVSNGNKNSSAVLPEFGSSSLFQTDISSQFDAPEKSSPGPQVSVTASFLQSSNVGLSSCNGVHSQQALEGNNDLHQKVKS